MPRPCFLAVLFAVGLSENPLQATVIPSVNGDATLASNSHIALSYAFPGNDIGWYYTPSSSYFLTGISTTFGPLDNLTADNTITATMQIQTDRPANGGTILEQGSFQVDNLAGGAYGISFPATPIELIAGQSYFIDLTGMNGLGLNVGLWADDTSGNPQPSGGATTSLLGLGLGVPALYYDAAGTTGFPFQSVSTDVYTTQTYPGYGSVNIGGAEPILNFTGYYPTPEPSSIVLLTMGLLTLAVLGLHARRCCCRKVCLANVLDATVSQ